MIQFHPSYPPMTTYVPQPMGVVPALPTDIAAGLKRIHQEFFPDLTDEEYYATDANRNEMLYKSGKLEQLAKYGTYHNYGTTYNRVKDNNNFKELIVSKYLNNTKGFLTLMGNLNSLEEQRQKGMTPSPQLYGVNIYPSGLRMNYAKYDMPDYLRMLNNFTKNNKISDDLKKYFLYNEAGNLNLYYTKLDTLDTAENPLDILIEGRNLLEFNKFNIYMQ